MVVTGNMNGKLKKCPFCHYKSHSLIKISDHLRNDHYQGKNRNGEEFECEKCPDKTVFGSLQMLRNHFHLVHATPPKQRSKGQKKAKKKILKRNRKTRKTVETKVVLKKSPDRRKKPLKCQLCDFESKHPRNHNANFIMREHMIDVHFNYKLNQTLPQSHPFQCPECEFKGEIKTHLFRHYLVKHDMYDKFLAQALSKTKSRQCLNCKENCTGQLCNKCLWKFKPIVILTEEDIENCEAKFDKIVEDSPLEMDNDSGCELIQTDYVDNIIEENMSSVTYGALEFSVNGVNADTENEQKRQKQIDPQIEANKKIEEIVENVSAPLNSTDFVDNIIEESMSSVTYGALEFSVIGVNPDTENEQKQINPQIEANKKIEEIVENLDIVNSSVTGDTIDTESESQNSQQKDDGEETIENVSKSDSLVTENTENVDTADNFDTNSRIKAMITKLKNQRKWQCRDCFKWFTSKRNYKSHNKWMHGKFKKISCPKCPEKFYEKLLFVSHYKEKHRGYGVSSMTPQESDTIEHKDSHQQEKEIEDQKISNCVTDTIAVAVSHENDITSNSEANYHYDKLTSGPLQSQFVMNEGEPSSGEGQPDPVQYDMLPISFYGCDKCPLTFPDAVQLHEHSKTHVSQLMKMKTERVQMQVYRCALCAYFTHSSSDMISHSFQNHIIVQDVTFDVETVE